MTLDEYTKQMTAMKPGFMADHWSQGIFNFYGFQVSHVYRVKPFGNESAVNLHNTIREWKNVVLTFDHISLVLIVEQPVPDSELVMLGLELDISFS